MKLILILLMHFHKKNKFFFSIYTSIFTFFSLFCHQDKILAQIIPDNSLGGENSRVIRNIQINGINSDRIDGGAIRGSNLFHSFQELNINLGQGAYFSNPNGINNIFTRVTGTNISNIFGTLGVLGNANLFLINPNGIHFGNGARLDLNGSFTATTAENILIDGIDFSPRTPSRFRLSQGDIPIAFGFNRIDFKLQEKSGDISVQGEGNNIIDPFTVFDTFENKTQNQLEVSKEQNINFIARNISLDGANLKSPGGTINLYAIKNGTISLNTNLFSQQNFIVPSNNLLGNILGNNESSIDASGTINQAGGSINVFAENLTFLNGSVFLIENFNNLSSGDINLNTTNAIFSGATDNPTRSGLIVQNSGKGKSPGINISTNTLRLEIGAAINSNSLGNTNPGAIVIKANKSINIDGFIPLLGSEVLTGIGSFSRSDTPNSFKGNIIFDSPELNLTNGGSIISGSGEFGNASDIKINAETILIQNSTPRGTSSSIASFTFQEGNAGSISIKARNLQLQNGGSISNNTIGTGNAGSIKIETQNLTLTNSVRAADPIRGITLGDVVGSIDSIDNSEIEPISGISSSASPIPSEIGSFIGQTVPLSGNSGNIEILASDIKLLNGSLISVANFGTGIGGAVNITTNKLELKNAAGIIASTLGGNGGNVTINSPNIQILDDSRIEASVGFLNPFTGEPIGGGSGGNITINNSPGSLVLRNASLNANATEGPGGKINIESSVIFTNRPLEEVITANSLLGEQGVVEIKLTGVSSRDLILARLEQINEKISEIAKNQCITPQRSEAEVVDLNRYGLKSTLTLEKESEDYETVILKPRKIEDTNKFHIEPHVIVTEEDGSKFLGAVCFRKSN